MRVQRSDFSSKVVGKIIAEAEAKKTFASAVPWQFFYQRSWTIFGSYFGNVVSFN